MAEHLLMMEMNSDTQSKLFDFEEDLDPDKHVFNLSSIPCNYYSEDEFNLNIDTENNFTLIHFNCRSLYANLNKIVDFLNVLKFQFDVIAFSETWLNSGKDVDLGINGYKLYHVNRIGKRGGGVALYIKESYICKIVESMSIAVEGLLECVAVEIELEMNRNITIACVYRAQGSNIETFTEKLNELADRTIQNKTILLCGDFNINLMNPQGLSSIQEFLNEMYSRCMFPVISQPTRVTSTCATIIDNIFSNDISNTLYSGILTCDITDHLPVFVVYRAIPINNNKNTQKFRYTRTRTEREIDLFRNDLIEQDWGKVYVADVNDAYEEFLDTYVKLYNVHCPVKRCKINKFEKKPWITKGLQRACKKKNKLYRDYVKYQTKDHEIKYKKYKNKLTTILRKAEKDYYYKELNDNKNNMKDTWKTLNNLMKSNSQCKNAAEYFTHNNKIIKNQMEIADEFNSYFVNVGPNIAKKCENSNHKDTNINSMSRGSRILKSMFLSEITEYDILDIVRKCKNKTSTDCDGIDMYIVKKTIDCILKPLTYIINLSFSSGVFPQKMKTAKIIPIFKNGDMHVFNNYRPISILSQFSKIIEKWFTCKLDNFLEKNNLLFEYQYGFRSNRSTSTALIHFTDEVLAAMDKKHYMVSVFLDLQKAFDTVNHELLLLKLLDYGIRGHAFKWLESYLNDRQQYVQFNKNNSKCETVVCGIPQGSVIGPKLFIIFINDLYEATKELNLLLFADDTTVYKSGSDLGTLINCASTGMTSLKSWFDKNKLLLNWDKTKFMIFGNRKNNDNFNIIIEDVNIERVTEITFLGVMLDSKMSWKPHVEYIQNKVSKCIGILHKVKYVLNEVSLLLLYSSLIVPYLTYCMEVWGSACNKTIERLCLLQKKAIRIINHKGPRDHTNDLFVKLKQLKFKDLVQLKIVLIMWKIKNKLVPEHIYNKFTLIIDDKSRRRGNFCVPYARTSLKQRGFLVTGVRIWNSLENILKLSKTINQLKNNFKEMFVEKYKSTI